MKLIKELLDQFEPFVISEDEEINVETIHGILIKRKDVKAEITDAGKISIIGNLLISPRWVKNGKLVGDFFDVVDGDVFAVNCNLTSLYGFPKDITGTLDVRSNRITNFKGGPKHVAGAVLMDSNRLNSFEGAPKVIGGNLSMRENKLLTSFHNIHKNIEHIGSYIILDEKIVKSSILGIFMISGLKGISEHNISISSWDEKFGFNIVEEFLKQGKDGMFDCQHALIDAGFDELAKS